MKFAAIDVGSNAVRLLLSRVFENGSSTLFKKEALVRMPIRLGDDAFTGKAIEATKVENLIGTMTAFRHLIDAYEALDYAACATSAMREATNGQEIADRIKGETGVALEIIDGRREAEIICSNRFSQIIKGNGAHLYIDVGGGSTELTLFHENRVRASRSFNIGTIRILEELVTEEHWREMKAWLREATSGYDDIQAVGSGGNINKIFRIARQKDSKPLSLKAVKEICRDLKTYTFEERITQLRLRPDRADVIVPAAEIFISVMKWSGIKRIYVPQVGLSDGLVRILYDRYRSQQNPGNGSGGDQGESNVTE